MCGEMKSIQTLNCDKMLTFEIINHLIETYNYNSYLEIGVQRGKNLRKVICDKKVGVDPYPFCPVTYRMPCDEFFKIERRQWLRNWPGQTILTVNQITWVMAMEEAMVSASLLVASPMCASRWPTAPPLRRDGRQRCHGAQAKFIMSIWTRGKAPGRFS